MCGIVNLDYVVKIGHVAIYKRGQFLQNRCWFEGSCAVFYRYDFQWILLVILSIVPFTILFVGNSMIIYKMIKYNIKQKSMLQDTATNDSQFMTAMLISISLVLYNSSSFSYCYNDKTNIRMFLNLSGHLYTFYIIDSTCRQLRWANNAANFFSYCISGRMFREELIAMLSGWFCCQNNLVPSKRKTESETVSSTIASNL